MIAILLVAVLKDQSSFPTTPINRTNLSEIAEKVANATAITKEEKEFFINALTRFADEPDSIIGKTAAQLANSEKEIAMQQLSEVLNNTGSRVQMFLNHQFQYEGIKFDDNDPDNKINNIIFTITNTADRPIKRIEGNLSFYDHGGNVVRVYGLATSPESPIPVSGINSAQVDTGKVSFGMAFPHGDNDPNPSIRFRDSLIRNQRDLRPV